MSTTLFSLDASCQPDQLILCISRDQLGLATIDTQHRKIYQCAYSAFDLYQPTALYNRIQECLPAQHSISRIRVGFMLDDWCWTPTSLTSDNAKAAAWIESVWPNRTGHTWVSDSVISSDATAWVRVPITLIDELKKICTDLTFAHASFTSVTPSTATHQLSIVRIGTTGFFSLRKQDQFLYGQPHHVTTVQELHYVLALLADKFSWVPDQVELTLSGQWQLSTEWMDLLQRYFTTLQGIDCTWQGLDPAVPLHWFRPLEDLVACE